MVQPSALKSYWVIFDTCTRPEYYLDVHNILALPEGWIYRYNYRKKLISDAAWDHSIAFEKAPRRLLLVYGQYENFARGTDPKQVPPGTKMTWVATRLGEIVNVLIDGDNAYYDIRLLGFPYFDESALARILHDLEQRGELPWKNWVGISGCPTELDVLTERGDRAANWSKIVDWFYSKGTQFADDSFWRIELHPGAGKKVIHPLDRKTLSGRGRNKKVTSVTTYYSVTNQQELRFELINRGPRQLAAGTQRSISITDHSERVKTQQKEIRLRAYFSQGFTLVIKSDNLLTQHECLVDFSTQPQPTPWPVGPGFRLVFQVRPLFFRVAMGAILGICGLSTVFAASKLPEAEIVFAIKVFALGAVLTMASSYVLYRELRFKID